MPPTTSATLIIGSGLVGSQIAKYYVERDESPVLLDSHPQIESLKQILEINNLRLIRGDIQDLSTVENIVKGDKIKKIIHTAAMHTAEAQQDPYRGIRVNIIGTANILEVARKYDVERVVFTSSTTLYNYRKGGTESGRFSEDNYPRPTNIYASTKLACENLGLNYFEIYGVDFVALRFTAVFGPWSGAGGGGTGSSGFNQMIEKSLRGESATIAPRAIEFIYSKDAARSTMIALGADRSKLIHRIYNIGMGRVYQPEEIMSIIRQKIPSANILIERHTHAEASKLEGRINLERSRNELGYEPMYDMPAAIDDYVRWRMKIV